jgi:catechol 2,3-dioxygenase-like lactoylglutathione lyase family enzyme
MFSHTTLGTNDLIRARAFYDTLLPPLGWTKVHDDPDNHAFGFATEQEHGPQFWVMRPINTLPATYGNGTNIGFLAMKRADVDAFHARALAAGGTCEGKPGLRAHYHPDFYGAYVRDPDGNKLSCVCHLPADTA